MSAGAGEPRTLRASTPPRPGLPTGLLLGLALVALAIRALIALPIREPGYFDAYYYYHVAQNMAAGRGMVEDLIWNYLDQSPAALQIPHPSHLYWMPLTTWIAWAGIYLLGDLLGEFRAALAPFILLSSALPPLSAWLAWKLWRRRDFALQAGLLTIFSGFYFLYWIIPDSYTPFALAVGLSLLGCWLGAGGRRLGWVLAGAGAGLSHLARADGVLLVAVIALLAAASAFQATGSRSNGEDPAPGRSTINLRRSNLRLSNLVVAGLLSGSSYLLVFGPWLLRNLAVAGTPLPGGGLKTLWLRSYDELFSYSAPLTPNSYLSWGLWPIVRSKAQTVLWNGVIVLGTLQFFLAPFAWLGAGRIGVATPRSKQYQPEALLRPAFLYGCCLFLTMALLFTFPSRRGSMLHSAAALAPWLMALVPAGIEAGATRFARWRRHDPAAASRFFGHGSVGVAAVVSLWLYAQAVLLPPAPGAVAGPWNERVNHYREVEQWLAARGESGPVLVVDPPAFVVSAGRPALAIPTDGLATVGLVADRFGARWLLVESDHAAPLNLAWERAVPPPGWRHAADFEDSLGAPVRLFERVSP